MRLRGAPARLEETTRDLPREILTSKPDDRWSIRENAGHILDLEPLWLARPEEFLAAAHALTAADLTNTKTFQARHNDRALAEILAAFRTARQQFVSRLDGLRPADFARVAQHPRLQIPMRLVDHVYFVAEHDDHHLARIWEFRRDLARKPAGA